MNIQAIQQVESTGKSTKGDVGVHHQQMGWLTALLAKGLEQMLKIDEEQKKKAHQDYIKSIYGQF